MNWKWLLNFLKKIVCQVIHSHQLCMPASINVFLWRMYVIVTRVQSTVLKV